VADGDVGEAEEGCWKALERLPTTPGNSGSEDATGKEEQDLCCIKSRSDGDIAVVETLSSNIAYNLLSASCSFLRLVPSSSTVTGGYW